MFQVLKAFHQLAIVLVLFHYSVDLLSQSLNLGTPTVTNYSREEYLAGPQSWDTKYLKDGYILFANNNGLLTYDGNTWNLYPLPNRTILRSIAIHHDKIFVGGQDELGYYYPDSLGQLVFTSIKDQLALELPRDSSEFVHLEDIWEMVYVDQALFFRSRNRIYKISKDTAVVFPGQGISTFLSEFNGRPIFNGQNQGLYTIEDDHVRFLKGTEQFQNTSIIDIIPISNDAFYILTERNGIHIWQDGRVSAWDCNGKSYLIDQRIASGFRMPDGRIAIGTLLGGLILYTPDGKAQFVLTKESGLQSNWISTITADRSGNLWLGTANGIDQINLSQPIRRFFPDGQLEGAVYDAEIWNDKIFFGTTNGLYWLDKKDYYNPFETLETRLVKNTKGLVWGLDIVENQLFLAHNDGAFIVRPNMVAELISPEIGAWKFVPIGSGKMLVGTYQGLELYEKSVDSWKRIHTYPEFKESSRILALDQDETIWVSHPYRGLYRISFSNNLDSIELLQKYQMPDDTTGLRNFVFSINNEIIVANPQEIFQYDAEADEFKYGSEILRKAHQSHKIKRLVGGLNKTWYISSSGLGAFKKIDKGLESQTVSIHFSEIGDIFVGGFENLYQIDEKELFLFTDKGLLIYQPDFSSENDSFQCRISSMYDISDNENIIYAGFGKMPSVFELPYTNNAIRFHFSSDYYKNQDLTTYSCRLSGLNDRWTPWASKNTKEYTNLSDGSYRFAVRARSPDGVESIATEVSFEVLPPWYKSIWAKIIYTFFLITGFMALVLIPRKKHKEITAQLISDQRKVEQEVERLKEEKLKTEIQFKNQELASTTMHLLQKNDTLSQLKNEITALKSDLTDIKLQKKAKKIINLIDTDFRLEDDWVNFSRNFDQVHRDFLKRIKNDYPSLTPKDQQLCAYLRMNLNTKEIAPLLNISVRGVEIHRYRLRKKIDIKKDVNLNEFMMGY